MSLPFLDDIDVPRTLLRLSGILAFTYGAWRYNEARKSPLNAIPTAGYSGILTSYISALKWDNDAIDIIEEGYKKYRGKPYRVATMGRWIVMGGGIKYVEELRQVSEDILSFRGAITERLQSKYVFGRHVVDDLYHLDVIRNIFTRNIINKFPVIQDEVSTAFSEHVPVTEEWNTIVAYPQMMHVVCRVSNRYFIGLPLCRDPGYRTLMERFALEVAFGGKIINSFPDILKPFVGRYLTTVPRSVRRAIAYLRPLLEERLAQYKLHGSDGEKMPNDLITWLIENATKDYHHSVNDLAARVLAVNFAAIHNTSMVLTHALYDLAIHPECVEPMRKEVEEILRNDGWDKMSMLKMRKVDSFLKESQRMNNIATLRMPRRAMRDVTLSDGTFIPEGTFIGLASHAMCKDEEIFPDAGTFKGFRFSDLREGSGELDSIKHQMVGLSVDHVLFGHGPHSCPGRFFAVNELKIMFAHLLLTYDVQLENGSKTRPINRHKEIHNMPNPGARVMFRKRRINPT